MLKCSFKEAFNIDCPGCGFQRSVKLLFQGDFIESISLYPATIPMLGLLLYTLLHLKFKFTNGAKTIIIWFASVVGIMLTNWLLKFI